LGAGSRLPPLVGGKGGHGDPAFKEHATAMKQIKTSGFAFLILMSLALASCTRNPASFNGTGGNGGGTGGSGGGGGNNNVPPPTFTIGGTIAGLAGTGLVLENNGADDLTVQGNGAFTFKTAISGNYSVSVKTQPTSPAQTCTITNGSGTATANVTNVLVNCGTTALTVGGSVSGLLGSGLVLQDNGGNNLTISGKGTVPFTFGAPVTAGSAYSVTVLTQPSNPAQVCSVVNGTGTANANVTSVQVVCTQPGFNVGGDVVGLVVGPGDTMELQNNAGDDLFVTGDTTFKFPTKVTNGGIFNVQVFLPPSSQPQGCNEFYYTGIAVADVSNVLVDCQHNDWGWESSYLDSTTKANNYGAVTTPLRPKDATGTVDLTPPPDLGTPGGRDFGTTWTDNLGRKWLFGGFGYPFPAPLGLQLPGFLNDLWVFDNAIPGWVPANLPSALPPLATQWIVDPTPLEEVDFPTTATAPGARWGAASWTDSSGNLFLFGGQGIGSVGGQVLLNDLWKCTPAVGAPDRSVDSHGAGTASCPWTLVGGSTAGNAPTTAGSPGGRWAATVQTDSAGNVWLFGGQGVDSAGNVGLLADLWKYSGGAWTKVAGPTTANAAPVYGTQGAISASNMPGGRQHGVMWIDSSKNVWLFGGFGLDSAGTGGSVGAILNDLWKFDTTANQWTWIAGSNLANQTGTYGTAATDNTFVPPSGNGPGSRWGSVGWTDSHDNLWFFGGWGYGTTTTDPTGFMSDIWEYQHSSGRWIWWKGNSNANQNSVFAIKQFAGLGSNLLFVQNIAGARRGAALWPPDSNGYVWVFGGEGYDASQGAPPGYLNDLWFYLPFPN
jgi:hypothetical protein